MPSPENPISETSKPYDPQVVEERWYAFWLENKCFVANPQSAKPAYSIVIPPPNVTGVLTLGHVLNNTIQDILARLARMKGFEVLWLPGTDHAGIATQAVVERTLRKQGALKHRDDFGREKFLEKVWEWKEKHGGIIIQQLRKLGCSCDWTRERFTMDEPYSRCVQSVFVDLYRKGRIYRGTRMVNWDPAAGTALSDEEVIMKEEHGHLWYFKYPVLSPDGKGDGQEFVTVATTRPETILGDEAVAVHPTDDRYQRLVGRRALLPLRNKPIPIIADPLVDPKFGTGCVKVTPAHDAADYEMAGRHGLPLTVVIASNGRMSQAAGQEFEGMDRFKARAAVVKALDEAGCLVKVEDYKHNVGYSERSGVPIEPSLSEQWFLRYPAVEQSTASVERGEIKFYPERWAKTYSHWMCHLKDWCISRQLWWGHRVPVWYHKSSAEIHCEITPPSDPENWKQDPDVLDTWFSAWLWPFATMGWPEQTDTLKKFYPTTDLVTGPDIIFFWVARMIMAGFEYTGQMPFRNVYFTGIIRDKQGVKMSKSHGNSPDPLDLIAKFGADALRFGIMRSAPFGQDLLFDEQHVELGRSFCNKLWNACRFRRLQGGVQEGEIDPGHLSSEDRWILLRLDRAIQEITSALADYRFSEAAQVLYRFFWSEYCDWHIESTKAVSAADGGAQKATSLAVIDFVLSNTLRLFHPFLPFITEELWHGLGYCDDLPGDQGGLTIMSAHWPKPFDEAFKLHYDLTEAAERFVDAKHALVGAGRNLRRELNIPSNKKINFILKPAISMSRHDAAVLEVLLNAASLRVDPEFEPNKGIPTVRSQLGELFLPIDGLTDVGSEKARLQKELLKITEEIEKARCKLDNPKFRDKAPPQVLEEHQNRLAAWESKKEQVVAALANLEG